LKRRRPELPDGRYKPDVFGSISMSVLF